MKILTLLDEMPRLPGSGTASRCFCIMRELSKKHSFTLLTTAETFRDRVPAMESLGIKVVLVPPGPFNERPMIFRSLKRNDYMNALDSIFFQKPLEIRRSESSRANMARKIVEHLREGYDLL